MIFSLKEGKLNYLHIELNYLRTQLAKFVPRNFDNTLYWF